jgi:hypothetical protein
MAERAAEKLAVSRETGGKRSSGAEALTIFAAFGTTEVALFQGLDLIGGSLRKLALKR